MNREILFYEVLKRLRTEKGISQTELASILGIDQTAVSKYEKNKQLPEMATMVKIANYFDVSLDELVFSAKPIAEEKIMEFKDLIEEIKQGVPLEELIKKYTFVIDGRPASIEEMKKAIKTIRFDRFEEESI